MYHHGDGTIDQFAKTNLHVITRIWLGDESFAFDLSSAQFGYHKTVTPWQAYSQELVASTVAVHPFGFEHEKMTAAFRFPAGDTVPGADWAKAAKYVQERIANAMVISIDKQLEEAGKRTLASSLKQRRADFDRQVLGVDFEDTCGFLEFNARQGCYKWMVMDSRGKQRMVFWKWW